MYWVWAALVLVFGLLWGSFFNVCIYRLPAGLTVNRPKRSFCFRCGTLIRWYDNIPVISYLVLKGKCRHCGSGFSARYALIELMTGILFAAVFIGTNPVGAGEPFQIATIWFLAFTGLLIVGTFTDLDAWIIPDGVTLGGALAGILASVVIGFVDPMPLLAEFGPFPVLRLYWGEDFFYLFMDILNGPRLLQVSPEQVTWIDSLANAVLGAGFGSGLLFSIGFLGKLLFRKDAMGLGDVKLFALVGATIGIKGVLIALMVACIFGAVAGLLGRVPAMFRRPGPSLLQAGPDRLEESSPAAQEDEADGEKQAQVDHGALGELVEIGRHLPRARSVHHLPFGPWIALGAVFVVIFQDWFVL